jgi:hypothetical protein
MLKTHSKPIIKIKGSNNNEIDYDDIRKSFYDNKTEIFIKNTSFEKKKFELKFNER